MIHNPPRFACGECGRSYTWKPELAGRKVKCGCGRVMTAPATHEEAGLYDLAEDRPAAAPLSGGRGAVASADQSRARAVQTIEYQKPTTPGNSPVERYFPDRVRDLYMPLVLIAGGVVVRFGYAAFFSPGRLAWIGIEVLAGTALMTVAILIVGRLRHIDFGPLPVAIMKLCAVAIAPQAVVILLMPVLLFIPFGGAIVSFCTFFALFGAMFDLEQDDTWFCVCVMFFVGLAVVFGMIYLG